MLLLDTSRVASKKHGVLVDILQVCASFRNFQRTLADSRRSVHGVRA